MEPPFSPSSAIRIFESRKIGQRAWRVSATVQVAGTPKTLVAYAYCSKAEKTRERTAVNAFPGVMGAIYAADARCKNGDKAMAGGFLVSPRDSTEILDSFRFDKKTWRSRATVEAANASSITSYAYCADAKKPSARAASVPPAAVGMGPTTAISSECKRHTRLVAGGYSQPSAGATFGGPKYLLPFENLANGKRWRTSATYSSPVQTALTAIAYCA